MHAQEPLLGLLSPWTLTALVSFAISFYASARSLQIGLAIKVIAITSVAANLSAILRSSHRTDRRRRVENQSRIAVPVELRHLPPDPDHGDDARRNAYFSSKQEGVPRRATAWDENQRPAASPQPLPLRHHCDHVRAGVSLSHLVQGSDAASATKLLARSAGSPLPSKRRDYHAPAAGGVDLVAGVAVGFEDHQARCAARRPLLHSRTTDHLACRCRPKELLLLRDGYGPMQKRRVRASAMKRKAGMKLRRQT